MKHQENINKSALIWAVIFGLFSAILTIALIRHGFSTHWFYLLLAVPSAALSLSYIGDIEPKK